MRSSNDREKQIENTCGEHSFVDVQQTCCMEERVLEVMVYSKPKKYKQNALNGLSDMENRKQHKLEINRQLNTKINHSAFT
jgi:hypothetical protein